MQVFISHWASAVTAMAIPIFFMMENTPGKSTSPFPINRSTASPVRIGTYSVNTTVRAASTKETPTMNQYLRMYVRT